VRLLVGWLSARRAWRRCVHTQAIRAEQPDVLLAALPQLCAHADLGALQDAKIA
jgi:hypothetical protein